MEVGREEKYHCQCVKVTDTLEVKEGLAWIKGNQSDGVKPKEDVLEFNVGNTLANPHQECSYQSTKWAYQEKKKKKERELADQS